MPKYVTDEELELFNSYDILETDGTVNYDNYQKWFKHYVASNLKGNNTLMDVTNAIEKANNVSVKALENKPLKDDFIPINGLFDKEELIGFIVDKIDVENLKKETKEMIKEVLKDDSTDNHEDNKKENKLEVVKNIIEPLLTKVVFDNNIPKNVDEELTDFLSNEGLTTEEIEELLKPEEKKEAVSTPKKEEKPYNPYTDWRYIYYMWTLGHDYSRFLFAKPKALGENKIRAFDEEKVKINGNKNVGKKLKINKAFEKEYYSLNNEFGLKIDLDQLIAGLSKENPKEFFVEFVTKAYNDTKSNINDSVVFIAKIDDLCTKVAGSLQNCSYERFGGLDNNEVRRLLVGLREPDCNLVTKVKTDFTKNFGEKYLKVDPEKIAKYMDSRFRVLSWDAEAQPSKYEDLMGEAIATYKFFKDLHRNRSIGFKLFSKSGYDMEKEVLENMKALLNKSLAPEKRAFIKETLQKDEIYKKGYKEELDRINKLSLDLAQDSYEIIESEKEKTTVDLTAEVDKEDIKEAASIDNSEVVKDTNSL